MEATLLLPRYISAEEFDLMFDEELDAFFDADYQYEKWLEEQKLQQQLAEKEAMETDYEFCK